MSGVPGLGGLRSVRGVRLLVILLPLVASGFLLLFSCADRETSATLTLSLKAGQERRMRFTTEQSIDAPAPGGSSTSTKVAFTYVFRVSSVSASGLFGIDMEVAEVEVSGLPSTAAGSIESLRRRHLAGTVDRSGDVLDLRLGQGAGEASPPPRLPGLPREPGSSPLADKGPGDMGSLFEGLNGRTVSVGETWATGLPRSLSTGLKGTLRWTLTSVRGSSVRLSYVGALDQQDISLPDAAGFGRASISGDASGSMEIDRDSGWPRHGQSVLRVKVTPRGRTGSPGAPATFTLRIVTRLDELP